jgi:hypothetical protein
MKPLKRNNIHPHNTMHSFKTTNLRKNHQILPSPNLASWSENKHVDHCTYSACAVKLYRPLHVQRMRNIQIIPYFTALFVFMQNMAFLATF